MYNFTVTPLNQRSQIHCCASSDSTNVGSYSSAIHYCFYWKTSTYKWASAVQTHTAQGSAVCVCVHVCVHACTWVCARAHVCACVCVHVCGCQQPHVKSGREQEEERVHSGAGLLPILPWLSVETDLVCLFRQTLLFRLCSASVSTEEGWRGVSLAYVSSFPDTH